MNMESLLGYFIDQHMRAMCQQRAPKSGMQRVRGSGELKPTVCEHIACIIIGSQSMVGNVLMFSRRTLRLGGRLIYVRAVTLVVVLLG
jgi:hypothetical protein